jgi:hypothetical protein
MTTRRSFLGSIIALAAAPAIVRASNLMPVRQISNLGFGVPITHPVAQAWLGTLTQTDFVWADDWLDTQALNVYEASLGNHPDRLITPTMLMREAKRILHQNPNFGIQAMRDWIDLREGNTQGTQPWLATPTRK